MVKNFRHPESTFREDYYTHEGATERARIILTRLDFDWDDLRGKTVVDLGSGPNALEQAARDQGITGVTSIEEDFNTISQNPELAGRVNAKAESLPLKSESVDLFISNGGSLSLGRDEDKVQQQLREILRTLKPEGEVRMAPPVLRVVWEGIADQMPRLMELRKQPTKELTDSEREELKTLNASYQQRAIEESLIYLQSHGLNPELKASSKAVGVDNKYFLLKRAKVN